jgi:hypothetical protein
MIDVKDHFALLLCGQSLPLLAHPPEVLKWGSGEVAE